MITVFRENDAPRNGLEKLAEYAARPPMPVLRFYGEVERTRKGVRFNVRNGLPIPLLYGVYVSGGGDYREQADHIGPFSTDTWQIEFNPVPTKAEIAVGIVPFEIRTDKMEVVL